MLDICIFSRFSFFVVSSEPCVVFFGPYERLGSMSSRAQCSNYLLCAVKSLEQFFVEAVHYSLKSSSRIVFLRRNGHLVS